MMRRSKKQSEGEGPNVPAYIVTFSDMVTLLLTFFVMLLSMAQVQDAELFNKSRDAFREYINCYGLGMLVGKQLVAELGESKVKFKIPDGDEQSRLRTLDSNEEDLRRLFNKVSESMNSIKSRAEIRLSDFTVTDIRFESGQDKLNESARLYLDQFITSIKTRIHSEKIELFVLGLSVGESNLKKQWLLSSMRAHKVARYIKKADLKCPVYAWGGGAGGSWVYQESPVSEKSHIFIAVCSREE